MSIRITRLYHPIIHILKDREQLGLRDLRDELKRYLIGSVRIHFEDVKQACTVLESGKMITIARKGNGYLYSLRRPKLLPPEPCIVCGAAGSHDPGCMVGDSNG